MHLAVGTDFSRISNLVISVLVEGLSIYAIDIFLSFSGFVCKLYVVIRRPSMPADLRTLVSDL